MADQNLDNMSLSLSVKDGNYFIKMKQAGKESTLLEGSLNSTGRALNGVETSFAQAGKASEEFVNSFKGADLAAAAFGASAGLAFNRALTAFTDFQTGVINVQKVIEQLSGNALARFQTDILALSQTLPLAATDLLKIAQNLGQLGFFANTTTASINQAINQVVELIAKVGASTDLSAEAAGEAFGTLKNIFLATETDAKRVTSELKKFVDVSVELSNTTSATTGDIIRFNNRIGATATALGLSFAQVSAYGAAVRQLGVSADVGGTALQGLFNQLTTKAAQFADVIGITTTEFRKLVKVDPNQAILQFFTKLNALTKEQRTLALAAIDGDARFTTVVQGLASNVALITQAQLDAARAGQEGIAVNRQAEKQFASLDNQLKIFNNTLQNSFRGGFDFIAKGFEGVIRTFNDLGAAAPQVLSAFSGIVTVGSGLLASLVAIGLALPKIKNGFQAVNGTISNTVGAAAGLGKQLFFVSDSAFAANASVGMLNKTLANTTTGLESNTNRARRLNAELRAITTVITGIGSIAVALGVVEAVEGAAKLSNSVKEIRKNLLEAVSADNFKAVETNATAAIAKLKQEANIVADIFTLGVTAIKRSNAIKDLEAIKKQAADVQKLQATAFDNFLNIQNKNGSTENSQFFTAASEALQKSFSKLGDKGQALELVMDTSGASIARLRKEFGLSDKAALALAQRFDQLKGLRDTDANSLVRALRDQLDTTKELARQSKIIVDNEQLLKTELARQNTLREEAVKFVNEIADKQRTATGDEELRNKKIREVTLSLEEQKKIVDAQIESEKDLLKSLGAQVSLYADGEVAVASLVEVQAENVKKVQDHLKVLEQLGKTQAKIDGSRALANKVLREQETQYQKALRETAKAQEEVDLTAQERAVNTEANRAKLRIDENDQQGALAIEAQRVQQLLELEKTKRDIALRELERERKANGQFEKFDAVSQAKRTVIFQQAEARRLEILEEFNARRLETMKQNNKQLDDIIRQTKLQNFGAFNADAARNISEQFEQMKRINGLLADEEKKRKAIAGILNNIQNIIKETIDTELKAKKALVDFDKQRAQDARDKLQAERQAAETALLAAKQSANLNSDAGKRALQVAQIQKQLADFIAERDKDRVLTAKEIDEIERARIAVAQESARINGQVATEQGRKQLADEIERIRLESKQLKERERTVDRLTSQEIDAAEKAAKEKNAADVKQDKGATDEERFRKLKELNKETEEQFNKLREELAVREEGNSAEKERLELVKQLQVATTSRVVAQQEENALLGDTQKILDKILETEGLITAERTGRIVQEQALRAQQTAENPQSAAGAGGLNLPNPQLPTNTPDTNIRSAAQAPSSFSTKLQDSLAGTEAAANALNSALATAAGAITAAADKASVAFGNLQGGVNTFVNKTAQSMERIVESVNTVSQSVEGANKRLANIENQIAAQGD